MIKVKINGIEVELERPMNVVEAAAKVGIHVPHFCYHKELSIYAGCRICMIEVKGKNWLVAGCTVMMTDGMEVTTESEKITAARRGILELQLLHHPLDCPQCDKGGECRLQDYAFKYGAATTRNIEPKREINVNYNNPLIERNMERCVSCKRCARICAEMQGDWVLSDMHRGSRVTFESFMGREEECVHCGHCVSNCPVGAIQSRLYKHSSRPWYVDRSAYTVCPYCANGCTFTLESRKGRILRSVADETYSIGANRGRLCVKGRFGYDTPNSTDRLTVPLIKKNGAFAEATWDEAAAYVAERFGKIIKNNGPGAIAGLAGGRTTNEENYLFQKFMRGAVGTNNIDNMARLGHINALTATEAALGRPGMTGSIQGLAGAKVIIQVGTDTATENPITGLFIKRSVIKNRGRLILVDAARNAMDKHAAVRMYARPGTIGGVIRGMIHHIMNNNLQDQEAESANAELFEKIKADVAEHSPEAVAERTGVDAESIKRAAQEFAAAETGAIVFGRGLTASHRGYEHSLAVCYLALVAGKLGKPSCGVYPMAYRANEQGACDMGVLPDRLPGYLKVTDEEAVKSLKKAWGVGDLSRDIGLTLGEMIESASDGSLKAMYVMGANPAFEVPGNAQVVEALGKLDLLVVQDIFMSETAELADVVLPAATSAEKEGTFTNAERRVQKVNPAIDVLEGTKTDGEIISLLSEKMGRHVSSDPAGVMAEISATVPGYGGVDYNMLGVNGVILPITPEEGEEVAETPKYAYHEFTPKGGGHACAAEEASEYPMNVDIAVSLYHSGTSTRTSKGPNMVVPEAFAAMNPDEMAEMGLSDGDTVRVGSKHGELSLKLKSDRLVPKGTVHIPNHFKGHGLSVITGLHTAGPNKTPVARFWPVNVVKE